MVRAPLAEAEKCRTIRPPESAAHLVYAATAREAVLKMDDTRIH